MPLNVQAIPRNHRGPRVPRPKFGHNLLLFRPRRVYHADGQPPHDGHQPLGHAFQPRQGANGQGQAEAKAQIAANCFVSTVKKGLGHPVTVERGREQHFPRLILLSQSGRQRRHHPLLQCMLQAPPVYHGRVPHILDEFVRRHERIAHFVGSHP